MFKIEEYNIISRQKDILFNKLDDEIVMMSTRKGEYYGLDIIGSRIWEILSRPVSFRQLLDSLLEEFDVSEEQCNAETTEFLEILFKRNLILIE
jgi:hypothetical protein